MAIDTTVPVLTLLPNVCDLNSAVRGIDGIVNRGSGGYICISTVHMVMESYDDAEFSKCVNSADLIVPDGMPLVWMQKLQGIKAAARVRGIDLMVKLIDHAERTGLSVGFYGGEQHVLDAIRERIKSDHPGLKIVYSYSPPFRMLSTDEDVEIVADINASSPDILFVGLGCPKQELWMAEHRDRLNCVMLGVGAAFDFYAGNARECPDWIGKLGLEWFFRLMQDPKRLWRRYLILNPRFVVLAAMQLSGLKKFDQ